MFQHGLAGAEGDLGHQSRLAHAGAAGEDDKVGRVQAAGALVQIAQAGIEAGDRPLILERFRGDVDRLRQRLLEGQPLALGAAMGGEVEQGLLGGLDLRRTVQLRIGAEGAVHHRLADIDELPAQPGVADHPPVIAGIDDADHGGEQLRQIGGAADLIEHAAMFEFGA